MQQFLNIYIISKDIIKCLSLIIVIESFKLIKKPQMHWTESSFITMSYDVTHRCLLVHRVCCPVGIDELRHKQRLWIAVSFSISVAEHSSQFPYQNHYLTIRKHQSLIDGFEMTEKIGNRSADHIRCFDFLKI